MEEDVYEYRYVLTILFNGFYRDYWDDDLNMLKPWMEVCEEEGIPYTLYDIELDPEGTTFKNCVKKRYNPEEEVKDTANYVVGDIYSHEDDDDEEGDLI